MKLNPEKDANANTERPHRDLRDKLQTQRQRSQGDPSPREAGMKELSLGNAQSYPQSRPETPDLGGRGNTG